MEEPTKTFLLIGSGGLAGSVLTLLFQTFIRWWNRPQLVLLTYEHRAPMYRLAPDVQTGTKMFWVNVGVRNRGRSVADRCRAVVTAIAELKQDSWVKDKNWLPLDLMWSLYQYSVSERDLIPEPALKVWKWDSPVVYYFNIAFIADDGTDQLHLAVIYSPTAQRTSFPPGIYAVQITVYSANGEWAGCWYELIFRGAKGSFSGDQLTVRELQAAPVINP
jgi:hypothetical protein